MIDNDLRTLLMSLSKVTNTKEYDFCVNTVAQLLMGYKFGYMQPENDEVADIRKLKRDANFIRKNNREDQPIFKLKPLKKDKKLAVIKGGKKDIDKQHS